MRREAKSAVPALIAALQVANEQQLSNDQIQILRNIVSAEGKMAQKLVLRFLPCKKSNICESST
jgi:hypothetical protein